MKAFTILEILVSLLAVALLAAISIPAFHGVQLDLQVEGAAANIVSLIERARSEAGKRGVPVVLAPSFDGVGESEIVVFADYHHALDGSPGSDRIFTSGTDDVLIIRWQLDSSSKAPIRFWSPADESPEGETAITGFTTNPLGADLPPVIVFAGNTLEDLGALRLGLSDAGSDELWRCREVDVALLSGQATVEECEGFS